jgi:hypothetical protein
MWVIDYFLKKMEVREMSPLVVSSNLSRPTISFLIGFSEKTVFQQYTAISLLICLLCCFGTV